MSDVQTSDDGGDEDEYHTCDEDNGEDNDKEVGVPQAAAPSSSSSEEERDYHHTSDEEEEEELDVIGAAPVVAVKKETSQLYTRRVTGFMGFDKYLQEMLKLQKCDKPNPQPMLPPGSQETAVALPGATGSGGMNTWNVQLNLTQQQFGDVTVGKATQVNQSFGGSQNISKTATVHEGQKGRELSRSDLIMKRTISHFQAWNQGMVRTAALDQVLDKLNLDHLADYQRQSRRRKDHGWPYGIRRTTQIW